MLLLLYTSIYSIPGCLRCKASVKFSKNRFYSLKLLPIHISVIHMSDMIRIKTRIFGQFDPKNGQLSVFKTSETG